MIRDSVTLAVVGISINLHVNADSSGVARVLATGGCTVHPVHADSLCDECHLRAARRDQIACLVHTRASCGFLPLGSHCG